ncbi:MAG TPA: hypothetical protein VGM39_22705 [Kofleriaceae bacterium]|jgi:hypothetical protein
MKRLALCVLVGCGPSYQDAPPERPQHEASTPSEPPAPSPSEPSQLDAHDAVPPQPVPYPDLPVPPSDQQTTRRRLGRLLVVAPQPTLRRRRPLQDPQQLERPAEPLSPSVCQNVLGEDGPVIIADSDLQRRHEINAHRLADVTMSIANPVELCGDSGVARWFAQVSCADGSKPIATRQPNPSTGGRCNHPVWDYSAVCPEQTRDVRIDTEMCGEREDFP